MSVSFPSLRRLFLSLACLATLKAEEVAADTRWIHCERSCRLELGDQVKGSIGVKISPYAHIYLTKLYAPKDSYQLQAGRNYYLDLIESPREGVFQFELRLTPEGQETAQVYEVRARSEAPFISIAPKPADQPDASATFALSTDRQAPLIVIK